MQDRKHPATTKIQTLAEIGLEFDLSSRSYHRLPARCAQFKPTVDLVWANGYREGGITGFLAAHELIEVWVNSNRFVAFDARPVRPQNEIVRVEVDAKTVVYYLNSDHLCTVTVTK